MASNLKRRFRSRFSHGEAPLNLALALMTRLRAVLHGSQIERNVLSCASMKYEVQYCSIEDGGFGFLGRDDKQPSLQLWSERYQA